MITKGLLCKEFRLLRWVIILGLLCNTALALLIVLSFHFFSPVLTELPAEIMEVLGEYEMFRSFLGIFSNYSHYVWSQWQAKNLLQIGSLFAILIAAVQFAGETSKKSIMFFLSLPISRGQGLAGKTAAGALVLVLLFGCGSFLLWVFSLISGQSLPAAEFFIATLISLLWLAVFYIFCCSVSILSKEPLPAGAVMALGGLILGIPGFFSATRYLSPFHHLKAVDFYLYGYSPLPTMAGALAAGLLLWWAALRLFKNRDF